MKTAKWFAAALFLVPSAAKAQNDSALSDGRIIAIRARRIETVSKGAIENGIVLIRDGKITAVGAHVKIPVGARVVVVNTIMPGIVGPFSRIGLSSAGSGGAPATPGFAGRRGAGIVGGPGRASANPHHRVNDELYPFDQDYERLLHAGVTTLGLIPGGVGINGQGAAVKLSAESAEKMVLAQTGPLAINFSTETQAQELIKSTLEGGRQSGGPQGTRSDSSGSATPGPDPESAEDLQRGQRRTFQRPPSGAFAPPSSVSLMARRIPVARAVGGETPTFVVCSDSAAYEYASQLLTPFDRMKAIYVLQGDSFRIANKLGEKKAAVVLPADIVFEPNTRNRVNPAAIISRAGAKIACRPQSDDVEGYRALRFKMSEMIRGGLDRETALKAITLHPAEMLGVADRVGSLEPGRDADLILLDGDPFSALTRIRGVILEGKEVYVDR